MAESFRVAKILGIDIELHWTFIALLLLTLWVTLTGGGPIFILIVLLFACVLIHELSHSFVSLQNKVKVKRIILLPLGGASMIDEVDLNPRIEFNIAIAGPLMSLFLCALFGMLTVISPPGAIAYYLQFLFEVNGLLGVFNLLPAFPMDGGRVFRSFLERNHNSYDATMLTIRAGEVVMALFILGTLVYIFFIPDLPQREFFLAWNLLIVFFIYSGAQAEKQAVEVEKRSAGIHVSDVTTTHFVLVKPTDGVQKLYDAVRRTKRHLLITRLGKEYAYVDLLKREKMKSGLTAVDIAVRVPSVEADAKLIRALEIMDMSNVGIAAVTRRGRIVGIVTMSHLQSFLALHVLRSGERK